MARIVLIPILIAATTLAHAQQPATPPTTQQSSAQQESTQQESTQQELAAVTAQPLPSISGLVLDVEHNLAAAEAKRRDYTYHVHMEQQELDKNGTLKKTDITESESLTVQGVRVDRAVARNGKALTPDEARKENERIDKEVTKAHEKREKSESKGKETDTRGDELITASRILELGAFSNPRRIDLNGRPTIVADYAGDPNAKTHNAGEGIIRDLVGTVWFDEQDRVLVRAEGHFLNDFKIGGGLILNIHKGLSFEFATVKVNGEVWLPSTIDAQGSARYLLFGGVNGRFHMRATDFRKFHTTSTIVSAESVPASDTPPPPTSPAQPRP